MKDIPQNIFLLELFLTLCQRVQMLYNFIHFPNTCIVNDGTLKCLQYFYLSYLSLLSIFSFRDEA